MIMQVVKTVLWNERDFQIVKYDVREEAGNIRKVHVL